MSFTDRLEDDVDREEGELYPVFRKHWYVLEDHEGTPILTCENPWEVEQ